MSICQVKYFLKLSFIMFLLHNCHSQSGKNKELIGSYKSKDENNIISVFRKEAFVTGSNLQLKQDSTYIYSTCGNISEGVWKKKDDSLFLFCKKNKYRIDSLNIAGFNGRFAFCGKLPDVFVVGNSVIEQNWKDSSGVKYINQLVKIIPD